MALVSHPAVPDDDNGGPALLWNAEEAEKTVESMERQIRLAECIALTQPVGKCVWTSSATCKTHSMDL